MTVMRLEDILFDPNVHARDAPDMSAVQRIADAMEAGVSFDPPMLDRTSRRIADGLHRVTAHSQLHGDEGYAIEVQLRRFNNDADILLFSYKSNAAHGRPLTEYDRARCYQKGEALGLTIVQISRALHMTVDKLETVVTERLAYVGPDLEKTIIRGTAKNLAGRAITRSQAEAAGRTGGWPQLRIVRELTNILEGNILDWDNQRLITELVYLRDLLNYENFEIEDAEAAS
jgi:hypothetical protein